MNRQPSPDGQRVENCTGELVIGETSISGVVFDLCWDSRGTPRIEVASLPLNHTTKPLFDLHHERQRHSPFVTIRGTSSDSHGYSVSSEYAHIVTLGTRSTPQDGATLNPVLSAAEVEVHAPPQEGEEGAATSTQYWTIGMRGSRHRPIQGPAGRISVAAPMKLDSFDELSGTIQIDREEDAALAEAEEHDWIERCDDQVRSLLHILSFSQGRFIRWSIRQVFRGNSFVSALLRGPQKTTNPIEPTFHHLDPAPVIDLAVRKYTQELQEDTGMDVAIEWFLMNPRYNETDLIALMTALEHLVHVYTHGTSMARLPSKQFKALRKSLETAIDEFREVECDGSAMPDGAFDEGKTAIKDGLGNLNRLTFKDSLERMLREYRVPLEGIESEIRDLVQARNEVVHRGIYTRDDPSTHRLSNLVGVARELLRRTFLSLLDYEGKYRTWLDGPGEATFKQKGPAPLGES